MCLAWYVCCPRLGSIIEATGASTYHGFLPSLVRDCVTTFTTTGMLSSPPSHSSLLRLASLSSLPSPRSSLLSPLAPPLLPCHLPFPLLPSPLLPQTTQLYDSSPFLSPSSLPLLLYAPPSSLPLLLYALAPLLFSPSLVLSIADDRQALIWDIQPMPQPIEVPILAYVAEGEINQVQWSSTQSDWIAICYRDNVEILRV